MPRLATMVQQAPLRGDIRALVVDDDPQVRRVINRQLERLGIAEVQTAADGAEAMRLVTSARLPYDVVLCDLCMPNEDGLVLLRRLADCSAKPAVILISGEGAPMLEAARRLGGSRNLDILGVASKPHSLATLAQLLARLGAGGPLPAVTSPPQLLDAEILAERLEAGAVDVWFQPQLDLTSNRIVAVEALARLRLRDGGLIMPCSFIATAEEHGLIARLTACVVEQSLAWTHTWQKAGVNLSVSINLSARMLHDLDYPDSVAHLCAARGVNPASIVFELTESSIAPDATTLLDVTTRLRLKRFRLSIDDFGTGYSSLEQLCALPFSELKIDQHFVRNSTSDPRARSIIENSLQLAKQLKLTTVAEGVETAEHLTLVKQLGCDMAQGYYVSQPIPPRDVLTWLARR